MWAFGIIFYMLFSNGIHPFYHKSITKSEEYLRNICFQHLQFEIPENMNKYEMF